MKYKDISTNFDIHPIKKDILPLLDNAAVGTQIKNLVYTNFYERPWSNDVGCGIFHSLFENFTPFTRITVENDIKVLLENYVDRVTVISVNIKMDNLGGLICNIVYMIRDEIQPNSIDIILKRKR